MKRFFYCCAISILCAQLFASVYSYTDFTNNPYLYLDFEKLGSTDAATLLGSMNGDTIILSYKEPKSSNPNGYRVEFELTNPDTIWIAQVKKPKLNKHYYLNYAYNGVRVEGVTYPNGVPYYKTPSFDSLKFIVGRLLPNDEIGRTCVELEAINSQTKLIWHIENECKVTDITLQNKLQKIFNSQSFYIENINNTTHKIEKVDSIICRMQYTFRIIFLSNTISKNAADVINDCKLDVNTKGYKTTFTHHYYFGKSQNKFAKYKFCSNEEIEEYLAEEAKKEAEANQKKLARLKVDSSFICPIKLGIYVVDEITKTEYQNLANRTGFIYTAEYNGAYMPEYILYCSGHKIKLASYSEDLENADPKKLEYLRQRGKEGASIREQIAIKKDSVQTEIDNAKAIAFVKKAKAKMNEFAKKQIFFVEHFYTIGEYDRCGIGLNVFNCYNKTIKYVDVTVTAYNKFNDPQKDTMGRNQKSAQCIGPIKPNETGYFLFNELFWNENGVISDCKATNVKITFIDNTTISFSGWGNIKQHYQEFFFDYRNPDYVDF